MPLTFTHQIAACVLLTPAYAPEIATNPAVVAAIGSKHTRFVDNPEEMQAAVYGTLQVVSTAQPLGEPAKVSVSQSGDESLELLARVAPIAFALALKDQFPMAVGVNYAAAIVLTEPDANAVALGLLNPSIVAGNGTSEEGLTSGGVKLIYDKKPWIATVIIEGNQKDAHQLTCGVNFHIEAPSETQVLQVGQVDELRGWFERRVEKIIGGGSDACA